MRAGEVLEEPDEKQNHENENDDSWNVHPSPPCKRGVRFELTRSGFTTQGNYHLSYPLTNNLKRTEGFEPSLSPWQGDVLAVEHHVR